MNAKAIVLKAALDEGLPGPEHFDIVDMVVDPSDMKDGDILVQLQCLSADPYIRSSIKTGGFNAPGKVISSFVSGKIVDSKNPDWVAGDYFGSMLPLKTFQIVAPAQLSFGMWKLTGKVDDTTISYGVGVLGMPGSTAYAGVFGILRPNEGETVFVSAASGAVGSLVGMLAKNIFRCKVIGSCGGEDKCALVRDTYGFDAAINYRKASNKEELGALLKEHAPEGIDMYFESVGGMHFDAAFDALRTEGRIAVCGQISEYNAKNLEKLHVDSTRMRRAFLRIEGFMCGPWLAGKRGNFHADMAQYLAEGKVKVQETFYQGIEQWPAAFRSQFEAANTNTGKVVIRV